MSECRIALMNAVSEIKKRYESENIAILLSGGVDTAAVMEANRYLGEESPDCQIDIKNAVTVLTSDLATDRPYASPVAVRHSILHHVLDVPLLTILEMLPFCVSTLKTFDGMTLRNSVVIALALQKAKDLGATVVLTGDGADELMGGYSYTWGTLDEDLWTQKRNELSVKMNFSTPAMASALGLKAAASPFLEPSFIEWVTTSTGRKDCISEMPIELSPSTERIMHITGKVCLREAFPDSPSAHRRKDPIETGSGATDLNVSKGGGVFFGSLLDMPPTPEGQLLFSQEAERLQREHGVAIKDVEHLYYYREFLKCFPLPDEPQGHMKAGCGIDIDRYSGDDCVGCGYKLRDPTDMFCYVCGAWPARIVEAAASVV
jgi:asparagine synthase (glutamine-hydrolysing)